MRYARFLRSFFSFFFYRAARGIYIVSRRVHSWWDAFQRIVSFSLSFFFLFFSLFFFFSAARCPRASDRSFWLWQRCRPLSISRMKTRRRNRSNLAIGPLFIASHPLAGRKLAESYFHGRRKRERERSDSSRNDSLECNKRAKEAVERTKEALVRRLWKFLLAFFEGSSVATRRRLYPFVCHELENPNLWTISEGRIFRFESNTVSRVYLPFVSRERDSIRHCRTILGDVET